MNSLRLLIPSFACAALAGCDVTIAPRELEIITTFDGGSARLEYWLRDVRVPRGGIATSLPLFLEHAKPEVDEEADSGTPWPQAYRWIVRDGGVDLQLAFTFSRRDFEACAREECDGGSESDGICQDFPFARCGNGYVLKEEVAKLMARPDGGLPSWPADAGVLRYSGPIDKGLLEGEPVEGGESAAAVVALYLRSPEAAEATVRWMDAYETAFTRGDVEQVRKLVEASATDAGVSPELDEAMRETVLLQRQLLLWAYLHQLGYREALRRPVEWWKVRENSPRFALLPEKPLAEPLGLKLRVAYETSRAGFLESGRHADARAVLAEVCGDKRARGKGVKRFCELLRVQPNALAP